MTLHLETIVEGEGEVEVVPVLLRRMRRALAPSRDVRIPAPHRVGRYRLVKSGVAEDNLDALARRLPEPRAILILLDADRDCPKELGPVLLTRLQNARPDIPVGVVLAKHEFEAWFLAAIDSLSGYCGLPDHPEAILDPEAIRNAKGALTARMVGTRTHSPVPDQRTLAAAFDMALARRRSDSFDKCWREVERLLAFAAEEPPAASPRTG